MSAPWIATFTTLFGLVVLLGLIVLGMLRRLIPLMEQAEERLGEALATPSALPAGSAIPPFEAKMVDGATFTDLDLRGPSTVVLFVGIKCGACRRFVEDLENGKAPALEERLIAVSDGEEDGHRLARSSDVLVVLDEDRSVARAFKSEIVPHVFVVEDGVVLANGRANDWSGIEQLLTGAKKGGGYLRDAAAETLQSH